MDWRLGLDLGANSLGWAALRLDGAGKPEGILAMGSRIFSDGRDPKSGASLAVDRRAARAMRRRRDRFKQRQAALIKYLIRDGLFSADQAQRQQLAIEDPYALRARALDEKLSLPELGRALFHLNQRRGFQSNRKADRKAGDDAGKIAIGVDRLVEKMQERDARTLGEFLHMRRQDAENANHIPSVRTRLRPETGEGAKGDGYDFYPSRKLIADEFEQIWAAQADYHPDALTPEVHRRLHEIIFHQRPLKAPPVGQCTLVPGETRLPKAHPLFQKRRLLEEINALAIVRAGEVAQRLTPEQRDTLYLALKTRAKMTFAAMRKQLKLDPADRFNKESENRTELKGDEVAAEMGAKTRFGTRWPHLSVEAQWGVVERLMALETDRDETAFQDWLRQTHNLSEEGANAVLGARLPDGHGRFGPTATTTLIDSLLHDRTEDGRVVVYSEAVQRSGLGHHSDFRRDDSDAATDALPYYGIALERHIMPGTAEPTDPDEMRIGRLTNPTVHIGLNQLRHVVNRLIRAYGPPAEIAVELARELKLNDEEKKRRNRENTDNRLAAEGRSRKLSEIGQRDTGANRALLKLWEELNPGNVLDRRCIYTGEQISIDMLFSDRVEVDHILPFAETLDDSNGNKLLCLREANREKRRRSPYEAWGHTDRWPGIAERASRLPKAKRWRFEPDAMQRFTQDGGFLARHLVDTQYLGRLAREYLTWLYPGRGEGTGHVWVSPGRLTEMVRRKLGLNDLLPDHNFGGGADQPKNRLDHRHHAIDAAVVAIVDRGMLNAIARASGQDGSEGRERIHIPAPWEKFRDDLRAAVNRIIVSHRADHGTVSKAGLRAGRDQTAGRLHNETAYGLTGETDAKGNSIVVRRVPLSSIKKPADIARVRDPMLRDALAEFTQGLDGKAFEARIARFGELGPLLYRGIHRVRVTEPLAVIPIRDGQGRAYKGYKGGSNYRYDVWELPDGKWVPQVTSMFEAHQPGTIDRPHPAARKVLSLHQSDVLAIERTPNERQLMVVTQFWQNGQVRLIAHNEAGKLDDRHKNPDDPYTNFSPTCGGLKKLRARQVRIDQLGRVLDPGFPARKSVRPTRTEAA
ncbi:type II CRISPR RNA-guided endonuclease Cas9 [uncultured Sphingomonas sp.]|uniref:type II CRISPR RNA-guided endonuclease Cas9 n=1 Tax=uncultured Sphingomonas sp. TaxID=158754 RepID=UPI0025DCAC99|nr:type II CRISPR RNA-guided endonuclease Cas9 [uncultured Sphingomonas sp.]